MLTPDTLENYWNTHQIEWAESLPDGCPPINVLIPDNQDFYRITEKADKVSESDFMSHQALYPEKEYKGQQFVLSTGISVFDVIPYDLLKFPKFQGGGVAKITLGAEDGVLIKSGGPNHYTWWRTKSFDITAANIIKDEKA